MSDLRLALRILLRDLRAGELHLLALAVVVAVAALVSVGFVTDRVDQALKREANQLLGGDLLLKADHPWPEAITAEIARRPLKLTTTTAFSSMVSGAEGAQLAGVKAVEPGYPLRGALRIAPAPNAADAPAGRIPERGEAWLDERLFAGLGVQPGDSIELGYARFRVGAMVSFESDRGANFFSVLPRVMINSMDLAATRLIQPGSRIKYHLQVAGEAADVRGFRDWVTPRLARGEALESVDDARPAVRNALDQAQRFLRLAALLAVILAAVAIGLSARRFMERHLDGCAVMRCLGAGRGQINRLLLAEFAIFGLLAAVLGGALGWAVHAALVGLLEGLLGALLPPPSALPLLHGLLVALVLLIGFALPQLIRLGAVPTLRVIRREWAPPGASAGLTWACGALALLGLLMWIAGELRLGLLVALGFSGALGLFAVFAWAGLNFVLAAPGRAARGGWRYGLTALRRRMAGSVMQVVALGVGLSALLLLTVIRADLLAGWQRSAPADAPNRFVINLQAPQQQAFERFFADEGLAVPETMPMIRGRMTTVNGAAVDPDAFESPRARRLAEREFNLSYNAALPTGNRIVEGQWHGDSAKPQYSVEKGLAETLGLKLGDRVSFVVGGQPVEAPITSVRALDWSSMRVNFFFIASPGVLDGAAGSLITAFRLPEGNAEFNARLVSAFPNISVIDVSAVLQQVRSIIDTVSRVVQFVFGFALAAGVVVLWAALQSTHDERARELALLRTLGARDRQLRGALLAEFALLGGLAGMLAGAGASAIGWLLAEHAFRLPDYLPSANAVLLGALLGAAGVVAAGWLGTRGLLRRAPLESLRALS